MNYLLTVNAGLHAERSRHEARQQRLGLSADGHQETNRDVEVGEGIRKVGEMTQFVAYPTLLRVAQWLLKM